MARDKFKHVRQNLINATETIEGARDLFQDALDFITEKGLMQEFEIYHAGRDLDRIDIGEHSNGIPKGCNPINYGG